MDKKYLVINSGSASHKHALYVDGNCLYSLHFEIVGMSYVAHENFAGTKKDIYINEKIFVKSVDYTLERLLDNKIILNKKEISAVGIRIVAPGVYFQDNRAIDREYVKNLKLAKDKSPLHISSVISELKYIKKVLPKAPVIGISDSAFHRNILEVSKYYALPISISREYGILKYGYHGLSVQSVISRLASRLGQLPEKVVVCHLGGGASVTAVLRGQSVDNSMGFTPLDGLVMATRVGNIDPSAVIYLSEKLKKRDGKLLEFFNKECGLLGLSDGKSGDIRELLKNEQAGDLNSKLALDTYALRVKKLIAQAIVVLGGIDVLVFAGTVGERSQPMRARICADLDIFGIKINSEINETVDAIESDINASDSKVKISVIKTDEMLEIFKETARVSQIL